jgi:uncharacterized membrane protein
MAKRKSVKRTKKIVKARSVRRVGVKPANKRLSILLIVLAIAVFVLAAITMSGAGI